MFVTLKLLVRDILSLILWSAQGLLGRKAPSGLRILLYHAVSDIPPSMDPVRLNVPPALFEQQVDWLKKQGYLFLSFDEALKMLRAEHPIPAKAVLITFDDGFSDIWKHAFPVLERREVPMTLFVVPQFIGTESPFPWLDNAASFGRPLTWEELKQLSQERLVSIGSHGWSHRALGSLSTEEQLQEARQSRELLNQQLGLPVRWFAYPYGCKGSYSSQTTESLKQTGYEAACSNLMGTNRSGDSLWEMKRTRIGWEDTLWRFRLKMAGAYDWIDRR